MHTVLSQSHTHTHTYTHIYTHIHTHIHRSHMHTYNVYRSGTSITSVHAVHFIRVIVQPKLFNVGTQYSNGSI